MEFGQDRLDLGEEGGAAQGNSCDVRPVDARRAHVLHRRQSAFSFAAEDTGSELQMYVGEAGEDQLVAGSAPMRTAYGRSATGRSSRHRT